ncbi:MAG: hypothetical protein VYE22_04325 [Myxococcota bacterium]|nr:hypothetical protein [Myxococcota bacterium]
MSTFKVEGYETREEELEGWPVRIASYQLGERFACKVDNVSPGAVIARGEGATREEAEGDAIERAARKLRTTRRIEVLATKVDEISRELKALKDDA